MELSNFQGALTTFITVGIDQPGLRILEVASGTGTHAEIVAQSLISKEGSPVFVTCDFSESMVKMVAERFQNSDFGSDPSDVVQIDTDTDYTTNG